MAEIFGTASADTIAGTPRPDVIYGLGGGDRIDGGASDDTIRGDTAESGVIVQTTVDRGAFADSFGYYDAATGQGQILDANVQGDGNGQTVDATFRIENFDPARFADLEFFLIPDGFTFNARNGGPLAGDPQGPIDVRVVDGPNGDAIQTADGAYTFTGRFAPAYFTENDRNPNGEDRVDGDTASGRLIFEDGRDNDRNDLTVLTYSPVGQSGVAGDDVITGGNGNDALFGDDGNDTLSGNIGNNRLFGGNGDDRLTADTGADELNGGAGNDTITAGAGNDVLRGLDGNDRLLAGTGDDDADGGVGDDTVEGSIGNDTVRGGDGRDTLRGDNGNDTVNGGNDDDTLSGATGDDSLLGGAGNDTLGGSDGADQLRGEDGEDGLSGGNQNDTLFGGAGADRLDGAGGDDTLTGDAGADRFLIQGNPRGTDAFGNDLIRDFASGEDVIVLQSVDAASGGTIRSFAALDTDRSGVLDTGDTGVSAVGDALRLDFAGGDLTIDGVTGLVAGDFVIS